MHRLWQRARLETFAKATPGLFAECFRFTAEGNQAHPLEMLLQVTAARRKAMGFETRRNHAGQINIQGCGCRQRSAGAQLGPKFQKGVNCEICKSRFRTSWDVGYRRHCSALLLGAFRRVA